MGFFRPSNEAWLTCPTCGTQFRLEIEKVGTQGGRVAHIMEEFASEKKEQVACGCDVWNFGFERRLERERRCNE